MSTSSKELWRNWDAETGGMIKRLSQIAKGGAPDGNMLRVLPALKKMYSPGSRVLDVGCCVGEYLAMLRKQVDPEIDYTGVDATKKYLDVARSIFKQTRFVEGDILNLPFDDNAFDLVFCVNVLQHIAPPLTVPLRELLRVSRRTVVIYLLSDICDMQIQQFRKPGDAWDSLPFFYHNVYSKKTVVSTIRKICPNARIFNAAGNGYRMGPLNTKYNVFVACKSTEGDILKGDQ